MTRRILIVDDHPLFRAALKEAVWSVDPLLTIDGVQPLAARRSAAAGRERFLAVGMNDYVVKPIRIDFTPSLVPKSNRTVWFAVLSTALLVICFTPSTTPNGALFGDHLFKSLLAKHEETFTLLRGQKSGIIWLGSAVIAAAAATGVTVTKLIGLALPLQPH